MKASDLLNYCPVCSSDSITVTNVHVDEGFPTIMAHINCDKCTKVLTVAFENKLMN